MAEHGHDAQLGAPPDGRTLPDERRNHRHHRRVRPNPLRDLCHVFEIEDLLDGPAVRTGRGRRLRARRRTGGDPRRELQEEVHRRVAGATRGDRLPVHAGAVAEGGARGSPGSAQQDGHRDGPPAREDPGGRNPITLGETPASIRDAPPLLGQHNDEILASLGYKKDEIADSDRTAPFAKRGWE